MKNKKCTVKKQSRGIGRIALSLAAVFLCLSMLLSFTACNGKLERETEEMDEKDEKDSSAVAIKTENFSVSEAQMYYYFYSQYQSTYNSLAGYGLDPSVYGLTAGKSLKDQKCTFDSTKTWFQYFMETAMTNVQEQLALCEAAKAAGMSLTDDDHAEIKGTIDAIKETAEAQGYSLKNYLKSNYGKVVSVSDVEKALEIEVLATKYLESELDKVDVSDETIKAIYDKDKDKYDTVDYLTFTFDFNDICDMADPESKSEAVATTRIYAEKLAQATNINSFEKIIKQYYVEVMNMSEEDAEEKLSEGEHIIEGAYYREGDEQLAWLFGKDDAADVKVGAVKTFTEKEKHDHEEGDDESALADIYTVILATRTRGTVEGISSVDVRHILFSTDTYKNDAEAKKIYEQWKKDGAKEDDFAKLAEKHTEDTGSKFDGGLYEGVTEGQMVDEFNDWIFAKDRRPGDHGIVKTTYGWHIMYYVDGAEKWQAEIKAELQSEASKKAVEAASDKYKATVDYDVINNVNA